MRDLRHRLITHGINQATPWAHEQRLQRRRERRYNLFGALVLLVAVAGFTYGMLA